MSIWETVGKQPIFLQKYIIDFSILSDIIQIH